MEKYLKGKKSIIWNFFTPENEILAMCMFCKQKISYKSSISNLKQHLQRKHPTINIKSESVMQREVADAPEESKKATDPNTDLPSTSGSLLHPNSISDESRSVSFPSSSLSVPSNSKRKLQQSTLQAPKKIGFSQKKVLDDKLLKLITTDLQPFSIVEDIGFRNYSYALNQSYILPSRKTLSNTLLPAKYEDIKLKTKDVLKHAKSVTLTTDCWTSINNDGFIAVTVHFIDDKFEVKSVLLEVGPCDVNHTSENLADELRRITTEWGVENKILLGMSDNAANIKKAISENLRWRHLGCVAHTINLIVKDALVPVEPLVAKVSAIVSHFKRSTVAKTKLDFYQTQNDKQPKKLIQSVATRWNSVFYMLKRIKELQEEVRTSLAALGKEEWPMLSNQEFLYIEELLEVLAPMESTTVIISSEKQVTLSSVIIITNGLGELYRELTKKSTFSALTRQVLENIMKGIETRFKNMETSSSLLLSTFLDPRYKHIGFSADTTAERAKSLTIGALTALLDQQNNESPTSNSVSEHSQIQLAVEEPRNSIWRSFDRKASSFEPIGTKRSRAILEVQRYMEEPLLDRSKNPLEWWRTNSYNFPHLSKLVKLKFGTVATSVPCERKFSKSGLILSDRRNRLKSGKVQKIMFINHNENI